MAGSSSSREVSGARWLILGLLILSVLINYIDRGALSVAAATVGFQQEMGLTDTRLGLLFSAFFWTYASLQVVAGYLADHHGVARIFAAGFLFWSAATVLSGFAASFAALLALRLLLGMGEAVAYPVYSKIIVSGFPEERRGTANALIDAGSRAGAALCVLLGGAIAARHGWRMMFVAIGGCGLLWLIPWFLCAAQVPAARRNPAQPGPGLAAILRQRQAWGTFFGLFCVNYTWTFILSWLPVYLTRERHYSTQMLAIYGSLPFWGIAASCALFGWISDRMIARGASPTLVRIGFVAGGLVLSTLMLPASMLSNQVLSMALLIVACLSLGLTSSNFWAITQTLAGPQAAGRWAGLQNGIGNLAGFGGPYLTGLIVARSGGFFPAFLLASAVSLAGACAYLFVVRQVAPVEWSRGTAPDRAQPYFPG
ncbi:MAG TPA: MFS transporter [Bryobacteraceae bacterium]|nr:MFS transporter [Bryobacteraceae bacterium]